MNELPRREREKQIREEEITCAAEKLFCQKGFDETSMDEIAREAQFTKRTLYQYFTNKEDLFFAVVRRGFQKLSAYLQADIQGQQNGYQKIQQSFKSCYRFYKDYPDMFRLISYIGYVRQKSNDDSVRQREFMQSNNELFFTVSRIFKEGQADGSVNPALDPDKTSLSLVFLISGFFNQLSTSGKTFTRHFSLDTEEFSLFTMDLLFNAIKQEKTQ